MVSLAGRHAASPRFAGGSARPGGRRLARLRRARGWRTLRRRSGTADRSGGIARQMAWAISCRTASPRRVAVGVVDPLEVVHVGHDERQVAAVPLDARPLPVQPLHQGPAVGKPGQRIDLGMLDQQVLQVLGPQRRADAGPQLEGVERLGHVIHGAEIQALHLVLDVRGAGEERGRGSCTAPHRPSCCGRRRSRTCRACRGRAGSGRAFPAVRPQVRPRRRVRR